MSNISTPKIRLLAAALSLALPAAHAATATPQHNGNTLPMSHPVLDLSHLRAAFANYAKTAPKSNAPQRAPMTRSVMSTADSGAGSLREALAGAVDGDVIDLSGLHGTILLSSALEATASVTINGPGRNLLTLDGGGHDRVLQSAHDLHVSNITIANGATSPFVPPIGGCIYVYGNLYLQHATITGCTAAGPGGGADYSYGGAIAVLGNAGLKYSTVSNSSASAGALAAAGGVVGGKDLAVVFSTISGNSAIQSNGTTKQNVALGGGVVSGYSTGPNAYCLYSTISGNMVSASGGSYYDPVAMTTTPEYGVGVGGGWASLGASVIAQSTVSGNTATANGMVYGGGAFFAKYAAVYLSAISNNTVASSTSWVYGGGVMANGDLEVLGSAFSGNQGTSTCTSCFLGGGAIFGKAGLTMTYSTLAGNALNAGVQSNIRGAGGAIGMAYSTTGATLTNSTITGNSIAINPTAGGNGAGIWVGGPLTLNNSTVAFNTSSSYGGGITANAAATNTLYSSIVANNTAGSDATTADMFAFSNVTIAGSHSLVMAAGANVTLPGDTLSEDPMLKPLAFNGGLTLTLALDPASPAIDEGLSPASLGFDQRGPGYPRVVGASADIGAYELDTDRIFYDGFNFRVLQ